MKAQVIKANGTVTEVEPSNGTDFSLAEMYEHTGCNMIQIVASKDGRMIIVDEEGKMNGKQINKKATDIYEHGNHPGWEIVGDALVCNPSQVK